MASKAPAKCCITASFHEGTPKGKHVPLCGLDTYVSGDASDRVIVIFTDVFGHKLNNTLLIADEMAKSGYKVLIPDILNNDPFDANTDLLALGAWIPKHTNEIIKPQVDAYMEALKKELKPKFIGVIGYCFGAPFAAQQISASGYADAGAIAHPSRVSMEEVAAIKKPIIISAAEVDPVFPVELRHETEKKLTEIGARYQIDLFSGVSHGYAVRGDILDPVVKYAKEKTLIDQIMFFDLFW